MYVEGSYGNEIVIECEVDGETLYFMYSHLNYGNPIAINPRTGIEFAIGDLVYVGDLIGFSGKTGNAHDDGDVPNKHLHLGISTDWHTDHRDNNWIDPAPYINGTINAESKLTNGVKVEAIRCD